MKCCRIMRVHPDHASVVSNEQPELIGVADRNLIRREPLQQQCLHYPQSVRNIAGLPDLQWEFFFTAWRYNLDFFRREQKKTQWKFRIGAPLYYGTLGRRYFGPAIKYPLLRIGRFPERLLRHKLYLDMGAPPKLSVPQRVEIPVERQRTTIPLHDLAA